ncbi:MAG: nucleotidyltransferase [Gemmatimonadota bacterium]
MANSVIEAFNKFLSESVNLDSATTGTARRSRDWLLEQIHLLPRRHTEFPPLYEDVDIHYGSFARRTKIRELDDLDLIVGIAAYGTTYADYGTSVQLTVPDGIALSAFCHPNSTLLNSKRVINMMIGYLSEIPQYRKADIKRNGSAAVLDLTSYPWSFDIVPGFFTTPDVSGRTFYIIPDGSGHWKKTDPRIDQNRASAINQWHDGNVLRVIRLIKYWNRRATMPTAPAYLIECMVLSHYEGRANRASEFVDLEFGSVLTTIASMILAPVQDPKGIDSDINSVSWDDRVRISVRATQDAAEATRARAAENAKDLRLSIGIWRQILGSDFPKFG